MVTNLIIANAVDNGMVTNLLNADTLADRIVTNLLNADTFANVIVTHSSNVSAQWIPSPLLRSAPFISLFMQLLSSYPHPNPL